MTTTTPRLIMLGAVLVSMVAAAPAGAQTCGGDCDGNRAVALNEIILGVRIALGDAPVGECRAMDGDGDHVVTVNELITALTDALQGCGAGASPTIAPPRPTTPTPTNTLALPTDTPTRAITPVPTAIDDAALAAAARVANESIFRLFDLQASLGAAVTAAGRSRIAPDQPTAVSGCQQFNCPLFGTHEDCCSDTQFSQSFSNCTFDDDVAGVVTLNGLFDLISDSDEVCTGAIPAGASFTASLQSFTHDVVIPGGSFFRTIQEISETFEVAPGGCLANQPDEFGFGIRGVGRRRIDGEVQQFEADARGNIRIDSASQVHGLEIAVDSTPEADGCAVSAVLNGSLTGSDVRVGSQFTTVFTDVQVAQHPQTVAFGPESNGTVVTDLPPAHALDLELNGTLGADCIGDVALSTVEPLHVTSGDSCFSGGRLQAQLADATVSATYTIGGEVDLDFGATGGGDQHFSHCTDVPADQCRTTEVGLCGTCTGSDECQRGLECLPCSDNCSGDTRHCGLSDTFVTCQDGVF